MRHEITTAKRLYKNYTGDSLDKENTKDGQEK